MTEDDSSCANPNLMIRSPSIRLSRSIPGHPHGLWCLSFLDLFGTAPLQFCPSLSSSLSLTFGEHQLRLAWSETLFTKDCYCCYRFFEVLIIGHMSYPVPLVVLHVGGLIILLTAIHAVPRLLRYGISCYYRGIILFNVIVLPYAWSWSKRSRTVCYLFPHSGCHLFKQFFTLIKYPITW